MLTSGSCSDVPSMVSVKPRIDLEIKSRNCLLTSRKALSCKAAMQAVARGSTSIASNMEVGGDVGADGLPMPCSRRDRRAGLCSDAISDADFDSIFEQLNKVGFL